MLRINGQRALVIQFAHSRTEDEQHRADGDLILTLSPVARPVTSCSNRKWSNAPSPSSPSFHQVFPSVPHHWLERTSVPQVQSGTVATTLSTALMLNLCKCPCSIARDNLCRLFSAWTEIVQSAHLTFLLTNRDYRRHRCLFSLAESHSADGAHPLRLPPAALVHFSGLYLFVFTTYFLHRLHPNTSTSVCQLTTARRKALLLLLAWLASVPLHCKMSRCVSLSHLTFYVSNAKQAALNWCLQFGFKPFKFRGLETGHRDRCSHAVKLNDIVLVFVSPFHDEVANERVNGHILRHGNSVNDVGKSVRLTLERTTTQVW